ncbi:uncharacterized protein [Nicotiana sylvestris]|uniref:uncharacterized protein n=1 Tax=Nicotiana sylvestris TaxID=4096 RepID=UPI00388C5C16
MCEPIFKLLRKDAVIKWMAECQEAFDKIKEYLSNPPVLVPPEPERPLFLYMTVLENSFGCVLGQHDITGKKEQAIYYLSKKFTSYEAKYILIMGDSDLIIRQDQGEWETRDVKLIPYRQHVEDLGKRFKLIEFRYIPRCHNELVDALATLASMLPYPGNAHVDPMEIQIRERHGYCNVVEAGSSTQPWYHDIKRKILPRGALYLGYIEGSDPETAVNADAVKRCNPKQPCKKQVPPKRKRNTLKQETTLQ